MASKLGNFVRALTKSSTSTSPVVVGENIWDFFNRHQEKLSHISSLYAIKQPKEMLVPPQFNETSTPEIRTFSPLLACLFKEMGSGPNERRLLGLARPTFTRPFTDAMKSGLMSFDQLRGKDPENRFFSLGASSFKAVRVTKEVIDRVKDTTLKQELQAIYNPQKGHVDSTVKNET